MFQVTKDQFYEIIGPLLHTTCSACLPYFPKRVMRWRLAQWVNRGDRWGEYGYEEVAYSEELLYLQYPYPKNYYVAERLLVAWMDFE